MYLLRHRHSNSNNFQANANLRLDNIYLASIQNFSSSALRLFAKKATLHCANCNKELRHKYKPPEEWNISGFLCTDCHIEKTKEFVLKKQEEKRRLEEGPVDCAICGKQIVSKGEGSRPKWQWNMESGIIVCKNCYQNKEADHDKKLNFCVRCNKKMGFIRYNPKPSWKIEGQLCRGCWDKQNQVRK